MLHRVNPAAQTGMRASSLLRLVALGALLFASAAVQADDFVVYSPHVNQGVSEVELRGYYTQDPRSDVDGSAASELSLSHAFTSWWKTEAYVVEYKKSPGENDGLVGYEFENTFQITEPGQYWADVGFVASLELPSVKGANNKIEFGPLLEKAVGRFDNRLNLISEKEIGGGASSQYEYRYSYSGSYALSAALRPGVEFYGRPMDHAYQAGPTVSGEKHVPGTSGNVEYRFGLLRGINSDAPYLTWLMQVEYEFL